jgi:hypothetical protein
MPMRRVTSRRKTSRRSKCKAMQQAGVVKSYTPLDMLKRAWEKASEEEREEF